MRYIVAYQPNNGNDAYIGNDVNGDEVWVENIENACVFAGVESIRNNMGWFSSEYGYRFLSPDMPDIEELVNL